MAEQNLVARLANPVAAAAADLRPAMTRRRARRSRRRSAAFAAMLAASAFGPLPRAARADHVVYSPLVEYGERAIEIRGHYDFDSNPDLDGGQAYKLEYEWTPTERWLTEVLVEYEREPGEQLT